MTSIGARARGSLPWLLLLLLLAVAVFVRLAALELRGHSGDVAVIHRWAERIAEVGPSRFYDVDGSIYPALLPIYWVLGTLLEGEALDVAIKGMSIPFDVLIGIALFLIVRRPAGPWNGLVASSLYLLNPATVIAGPLWGQVDAAGTLLFLGALVMLARGHWAWAGALVMLAGLAKPQFGLVALPLAFLTVRAWWVGHGPAPLWRATIGAVAAYAAVATPLLLDPFTYLDQLTFVANYRPFVSLYALNPWGLLVGFEIPDDPYFVIGSALLVAGLLAAVVPLFRRRDLPTLLAVGAFIAFAFYFLPTRAHERYLFPVLAVLAPFAAVSVGSLLAYVVLSGAFALSLLHALANINPPAIAEPLRATLLGTPAIWAMGLALMGAAVVLVWLLLRGAGDSLADRSAADP